jgi:Integrase core domain
MIRDRDRIYGTVVTRRLRAMGIRDKPTAAASPWQNGFVERLIGSIRRECADHTIALDEMHLRRVLKSYADYYNCVRTHRSLKKDAPVSRPVQFAKSAVMGGAPIRQPLTLNHRVPGSSPGAPTIARPCKATINSVAGLAAARALFGPGHNWGTCIGLRENTDSAGTQALSSYFGRQMVVHRPRLKRGGLMAP